MWGRVWGYPRRWDFRQRMFELCLTDTASLILAKFRADARWMKAGRNWIRPIDSTVFWTPPLTISPPSESPGIFTYHFIAMRCQPISKSFRLAFFWYTDYIIHMAKRTIKNTKRKKNPAAVALGRLGGLKGGPGRMAKLTPERRSEIARNAVLARWNKRKK